jgi:hypothetical protein
MPPSPAPASAWDETRVRVRVALADPVLLGFVGSVLVALGSLGVGIVPKPDPIGHLPLLGMLRSTVGGTALATASIVAGIAVLLTAWLAIGRDLRAGVGPGPGELRRTLWLWSWPLLLTPPLFSRDTYSYAAQANLVRHGYDAYAVGPWVIPGPFADSVDPLWATTPAPYGPLFLWVAGAVSRVTGDSVYLTVLGMRVLALVGVWLLVRYVPRLAAATRVDPAAALWLGVVNPLTLMHFVSGAHNDALMLGLVVAGLALALEGSLVAGAAVLAVAAGVKAPAAVVLGFVAHLWAARLAGRHRLLRGFCYAGGTAFAVFLALTVTTRLGFGWIAALDTPGSVKTLLSPPTAIGMLAGEVGQLLGLGDHTWELVDAARTVSGLLAAALIARLLLRPVGGLRVDPVRGTAILFLALVVLGPVVQPWYLMWALVPLAAAGVRRAEAVPVAWGVVAAVVVSQINGSTMIGVFAVPGTLACLVATAVVVARARAAERDLFGSAAVFDLAAVRPGRPVDLPGLPARESAAGSASVTAPSAA